MTRLLIIDDEIQLRETISELFTMTGYEVFEAKDGIEGIEKAIQLQPDLIICDVMMPKLDGYGFLERLNQTPLAKIPVLFLTARTELIDKEKGKALGAREYIIKPFSFQDLNQIVKSHLPQKPDHL